MILFSEMRSLFKLTWSHVKRNCTLNLITCFQCNRKLTILSFKFTQLNSKTFCLFLNCYEKNGSDWFCAFESLVVSIIIQGWSPSAFGMCLVVETETSVAAASLLQQLEVFLPTWLLRNLVSVFDGFLPFLPRLVGRCKFIFQLEINASNCNSRNLWWLWYLFILLPLIL